jgi:hypothetical protein
MFGRTKSAMSEAQRLRWEQTRKLGEVIYCLRSAFWVGSIPFIVHSCPDLFVHHHSLQEVLLKSIEPTAIGFVAGLFTGFWDWHTTEDRYIATQQQQHINETGLIGSDRSQRGTLNGNNY